MLLLTCHIVNRYFLEINCWTAPTKCIIAAFKEFYSLIQSCKHLKICASSSLNLFIHKKHNRPNQQNKDLRRIKYYY